MLYVAISQTQIFVFIITVRLHDLFFFLRNQALHDRHHKRSPL